MSRILSQEEIDALLQAATVGGTKGDEREEEGTHAVSYNFRKPDRVSKEQLRSLQFLHDRFAVNVSTSLSVFLRTITEVTIASVEQFAYSEFLMSLADPTAIYALSLGKVDGLAALEINPPVAFAMVDRMLGGAGNTQPPNRALTEIEQNVLDSVVKLLCENLTETWHSIGDVEFKINSRDTRPQMLQITSANEIVILISFDLHIGETRGMLNVCIPATSIETMEDKVAAGWHRTRREPSAAEVQKLNANIGRVPLRVSTQIEARLTARDLVDLQPGDVLSLGRPANRPVDVLVGRLPRYKGHLTTVGQSAGVLIATMADGTLPQLAAGEGER